MNNSVYSIDRIGMGRLPGSLKASALINGDIHHYRTFFHLAEHFPGHQGRRLAAREEHGQKPDIRAGLEVAAQRLEA